MKKINNRWVDENNNSWDCSVWSKKEAKKLSSTMINCRNCRDCRNCSYCRNCCKYKENPKRYVSQKLGRENRQTYIYWTSETDIWFVCGCFRGNLEQFKLAVEKTHGDNKHGRDYNNLIKIVEKIVELEGEYYENKSK